MNKFLINQVAKLLPKELQPIFDTALKNSSNYSHDENGLSKIIQEHGVKRQDMISMLNIFNKNIAGITDKFNPEFTKYVNDIGNKFINSSGSHQQQQQTNIRNSELMARLKRLK